MAGSLRDQLVKAGLATTHKAKKAERQARAEKHSQRHGNAQPGGSQAPASDAKARAQQRHAEKTERDRALARAANEKAAVKALRAEIKQIILHNDQRVKATGDDDVPYNFLHGKKIKRIYIPRAQQDQLAAGSLVIVNNDGHYHLVSKSVAGQIRARDPKRIIAAHRTNGQADGSEDDYYAKFEVPDDLDW